MQVSINVNVTRPRWLQTKTRRKVVALALAATLVIPGVALASHQFTDVPDSNIFHDNISRLFNARITNGCTATKYCPDAAVTRGQMAAFMTRVGGRVAFDPFPNTALTGTEATLATVTIRAGDVPGGTANVLVHVDLSAYSYTVPSDSTVHIFLNHGATVISQTWIQIPNQGVAGYGISSGSISNVVGVPTGVDQTFTVSAFQESPGTPIDSAYGSITATYDPFSGLGENPSISAASSVSKGKGGPAKR